MADENVEVCGFIDIKYLSGKHKIQKMKKKTLTSWKVWKRHWCSIKKLDHDLGAAINLDYGIGNNSTASLNNKDNTSIIPLDAIVCRAQSRSKQFAFAIFSARDRKPLLYLAGNSEIESQRWMANIRQLLKPRSYKAVPGSYCISIVDNAHSKASGFVGLHGDLVANRTGVFLKDVNSGKVIENFKWAEFEQSHLITSGYPEDVKCICVIHTSNEFRGGTGELHIFCLEAGKLLQDLVTEGRNSNNLDTVQTFSSLNEGNFRLPIHEESSWNNATISSIFATEVLNTSIESFSSTSSKMRILQVADHFKCDNEIFNVQRRAVENMYQPEPASIPHTTTSLENLFDLSRDRRISDISTASGIYEEIANDTDNDKIIRPHYSIEQTCCNNQLEEPPPLPPRQRCKSDAINSIRPQNLSNPGDTTTPIIFNEDMIAPRDVNAIVRESAVESCNYVPMTSQLKDITLEHVQTQKSLEENEYVIMR